MMVGTIFGHEPLLKMPKPDHKPEHPENAALPVVSRRDAVREIAKFAVYVAPSMAVLLKGDSAVACHKGTPHGNQICSPVV